MKSLFHVVMVGIALFATLLLCFPVQAEVTLNADLEIDTSYITKNDDRINTATTKEDNATEYDTSGRIKLVPSVRKESGSLYMEAKAEILAKTDSTVGTDDVWGKIGTANFDFQIGRFEAWDLFGKSNDMLILDAPNGAPRYETNYARGRFDAPGQMAVHIIPNDAFKMELGIVYGKDEKDETYSAAGVSTARTADQNYMGLRPVVDLTFGNVEVLAGVDYLTITDQNSDWESETNKFGYGARVKAVFGIATLNINYAHGVVGGKDVIAVAANGDMTTEDKLDETTNSFGGYCDLALGEDVLTLATIYTTWEQEDNDYEKNHAQYYAAYAHPLPIDGATIKFGISYATATEETSGDDLTSDAFGFKMRLNYNF